MVAPVLQSFGPGNVDETLTATWYNMIPGIRDNVYKNNVFFNWLYKKNNMKMKLRGGAAVSHGIMYESNSTAAAYQRYDILDTTPQDGLTRDLWDWRQYDVSVSIDGYSERINAGGEKLEDILETKKMQAEEALHLLFEQHLFAASPGTKSLRSLPVIVLASGTEGGINGTTQTWWESQVTASGSFAARGRSDLTNLWNTISIQNPVGGPELILSDQNSFEYYEASLVAQKRFQNETKADAAFTTLTFKGTPWAWSPQATSGVIYMLHSKGLDYIVHSGTDFLVKPFVQPSNQDARVGHILHMHSLTTGNRRKLGKLTGVTA